MGRSNAINNSLMLRLSLPGMFPMGFISHCLCVATVSIFCDSFRPRSIDCCMTSPPYWGQREYANGGIGLEPDYAAYIQNLLAIALEIQRVLKKSGSFWLNLGDTYHDKGLMGIPWRVALALVDEQGWLMRNDVIWNKLKGTDNTTDKLRNIHEYLFHFVRQPRGFYYNADAIRNKPRATQIKNGAIVSATGVTGVRYRRQIELSTALTEIEKANAFDALDKELSKLSRGEMSDFRMVIRNQQRTTTPTRKNSPGVPKNWLSMAFIFCAITQMAANPVMYGKLSQKTRRSATVIMPHSPPTSVEYPFWRPVHRTGLCSIRSAEPAPRTWLQCSFYENR